MKADMDNMAVILVRPRIPENIGSTARAMHNMGLGRLILVEPEHRDLDRILKTATGTSKTVVENMEVYEDLKEAICPFNYLVGTTARTGSLRPTMARPRVLAQRLVQLSQDNLVGILFGPEDRGLSNKHLRHCHALLTIPTASFSSLNLAQAVMIVCYEIFTAGVDPPGEPGPRLANSFELEGMYDHLQDVLLRIGFINHQNPEHWIGNIRRFLGRFPLRAREVRVIRGVCRQIDWYASQAEKRARGDDEDD